MGVVLRLIEEPSVVFGQSSGSQFLKFNLGMGVCVHVYLKSGVVLLNLKVAMHLLVLLGLGMVEWSGNTCAIFCRVHGFH